MAKNSSAFNSPFRFIGADGLGYLSAMASQAASLRASLATDASRHADLLNSCRQWAATR